MFCGLLVFQSGIASFRVLGATCVSLTTLHCSSIGFCIALRLCSVGAKFLGSSKQGLYFCCKVYMQSVGHDAPSTAPDMLLKTENTLTFLNMLQFVSNVLFSSFEGKQVWV